MLGSAIGFSPCSPSLRLVTRAPQPSWLPGDAAPIAAYKQATELVTNPLTGLAVLIALLVLYELVRRR